MMMVVMMMMAIIMVTTMMTPLPPPLPLSREECAYLSSVQPFWLLRPQSSYSSPHRYPRRLVVYRCVS